MPRRDLYALPLLYDLVFSPDASLTFYGDEARRLGGPVLELACGTGRLTLPLALDGHDVVGLDRAPAMLSQARTKAERAGVAIEFVRADMRKFLLPQKFRMIFVAMNSLLHLTRIEDLQACLARVRQHLHPQGAFVFDIFNPDPRTLARDHSDRTFLAHIEDPELGPAFVQEATNYDSATQVSRATLHLVRTSGPALRIPPVRLRHIFPQELLLLLQVSRFVLEDRYGDFHRNPFTSRSAHQVCVCRLA